MFNVSGTVTTRRGMDIRAMTQETNHERKRLMASMRRTLLYMEQAGVPKTTLLEILETSARELRAELVRQGVLRAPH